MKAHPSSRSSAFTLLETVIAIGVLAVLLTGFMVVFTPAAQGINKAISVQDADRLISTLEQELTNPRTGSEFKTGFEKAYDFIKKSGASTPDAALLVYQYRGNSNLSPRSDGTLVPLADEKGKLVGKDYVITSMVRKKNDPMFKEDITAIEGEIFLVKCTQLVFGNGGSDGLITGTPGEIKDPKGESAASSAADYPEAVIAFSTDLYPLSGKSWEFLSSPGFVKAYGNVKTPVFSRNLAVRR